MSTQNGNAMSVTQLEVRFDLFKRKWNDVEHKHAILYCSPWIIGVNALKNGGGIFQITFKKKKGDHIVSNNSVQTNLLTHLVLMVEMHRTSMYK